MHVTFEGYHDTAAISALFGLANPIVHAAVVSCPKASEVELVEFEQPRRSPDLREPGLPGLMAVNFTVTDVDAIVSRLRDAGFEPASRVVPQVLRMARRSASSFVAPRTMSR